MNHRKPKGKTSVRLSDPRALRAVAHPTRLALIGLLRAEGAMTATQAAERLGQTPQRCTFHLNQLAKYGLVEEAGGGHGRERPWRATAYSTQWPRVVEGPAAAATELLESVLAELYFEKVARWIERRAQEPNEWQEAAAFGDTFVYLTARELAQLSREVRSLAERFIDRTMNAQLRPAGSRPVTFLHLAFPTSDPESSASGKPHRSRRSSAAHAGEDSRPGGRLPDE
jgi:predicted ArsR family transcriptional regulator